jgi:alcohol dehydrogenase
MISETLKLDLPMATLHRQSLTAYAEPLCETIADRPRPTGSDVLLRVTRCGVCHSDLHMQDGFFLLGDGKQLDVRAGRALPFTLGHEIAGVVEEAGPDADGAEPGRTVAVYPWIGCGTCAACRRGEENICSAPRHLGIYADGGFATHVMVPHPRYLIDYAPLSPSIAATLMCSGLTAYAAVKRLCDHAAKGPALIVGLGGVGMMALALAPSLLGQHPMVADIDPAKRETALAMGATAAFDPSAPDARKALMKLTNGGALAVCDTVGSDRSLAFASGTLARGGKVLVTGLFGGTFSMPAAYFALKAIAIEGIQTGTLAEARELIALAQKQGLRPLPLSERPLQQAQAALDELRAGRVVGRIVLTN